MNRRRDVVPRPPGTVVAEHVDDALDHQWIRLVLDVIDIVVRELDAEFERSTAQGISNHRSDAIPIVSATACNGHSTQWGRLASS